MINIVLGVAALADFTKPRYNYMHMRPPTITARRLTFLPLAMILCISAQAEAAVSTWVAPSAVSGANKFSNAANWDAFPTPNCDLVFPDTVAFTNQGAPENDMVGLTVNAINIYQGYAITGNAVTCNIINHNHASTASVSMPLATAGAAALTITVTNGGTTLNLSGQISGAGPVTYGGPGIKRLNGTVNNTLTGMSTVALGVLSLDSAASEEIAGPLVVNSGATATLLSAPAIKNTATLTVVGIFDMSAATGNDGTDTETVGGLLGSATGIVSLGTRTLGCTAQVSPTNYGGGFSGTGSFRQSVSGTQVLSGVSSTNTGATMLAGGSIHVWGNHASSAVAVTAGTLVLANDCTVGNVTISGGASSVLSFDETISAMAMHGTTPALVVGSGSDFQVVSRSPTLYSTVTSSAVTITGAVLTVDTSYFTPTVGSVMTIIDNTHASNLIIGTFAGLAQGAIVTSATNPGTTFTISYTAGPGANNVTLTGATVAADSTAPVIASPTSGGITATSATVTWTTTELSNSQVEYGLTNVYGSMTTLDPSMVNSHSVTISGLTASTLYHYRVRSRDAAGNLGTGPDGTFTTSAAPPGGGGGGGGSGASSGSSSGCGSGGAVAVLSLMLMLGMTLLGSRGGRR